MQKTTPPARWIEEVDLPLLRTLLVFILLQKELLHYYSFADIFEFIKLCFSIPFSNAKVERFFNFMKIIKTDWRSWLGEKNLTSLIRFKVEGPNSDQFSQKDYSKS